MSASIYEAIYRAVPLFRTLTPDELGEMYAISRLYSAKRGYVVMREGSASDGMYILLDGKARVSMRLFQGDRTTLATLERGDVCGELSLIDRSPRSATVEMLEDGRLYRVDAEGFDRMRRDLRPAAFKVMRELAPIICERLRTINERVGELFADPERSMAELEKRYLADARHSLSRRERR